MGPSAGWGVVSGDIQGVSNSVSQVDGVSDMAPAYWLFGSVGRDFRKGTVASACLDARHFIFSLYVTRTFQAVTPLLELKGRKSE